MTIQIDHITIPARDKAASMNLMAELLGVEAGPVVEPFAIVALDGCTLDYVHGEDIQMQHVALRLDDDEFDAMYRRMIDAGIDIFGHPQKSERPGERQDLLSARRRSRILLPRSGWALDGDKDGSGRSPPI